MSAVFLLLQLQDLSGIRAALGKVLQSFGNEADPDVVTERKVLDLNSCSVWGSSCVGFQDPNVEKTSFNSTRKQI